MLQLECENYENNLWSLLTKDYFYAKVKEKDIVIEKGVFK